MQPQTERKWFAKRKRICVIPQAVNLDTSLKYCWDNGDDCLLVMYTYAYTIYNKWSVSSPYLQYYTKGVQALQPEIRTNGWLHFFCCSSPVEPRTKQLKMKKKTSIIVLSAMSALCVVLLAMVIFLGGYKSNYFKRQFVKLGWAEMEAKDKADYYCVRGWNQCLKKLNIDVDVAFYGNSITSGSDFREFFPDVSICNLGYPGDDLPGLRFRAYTIAAVNPEKVFVLGGINGLKQTTISSFTNQYTLMIKAIEESVPNAQIYLQSILPVKDKKLTEKIQECNSIIDSLANMYGCQYVDLFSIYVKDGAMNTEYSTDGTHLKSVHYDKWAERIRPYIYE